MAPLSLVLCSQQLKIIVFSIYLEVYSNKPRPYNYWLQVNGLQIFNTFVSKLSKHFANIKFSWQGCSQGRERDVEHWFVPRVASLLRDRAAAAIYSALEQPQLSLLTLQERRVDGKNVNE